MNLSRFFSWFFGRFFSIELGPSFPGRPIFIQFVPAGAGAAVGPAAGVVAAGVGVAGRGVLDDGLDVDAAHVGVALVAAVAHTVGLVEADRATGVVAAGSLAGVPAALLQTALVVAALRVGDTLGAAVGRGAEVALLARARRHAVLVFAVGVGPARVGSARVHGLGRVHRLEEAVDKWVACVAGRARAERVVGGHPADGVGAADSRAGVLALLEDAGLAGAAVAVDDALGAAVGRGAHVARLARAHARAAAHALLAVGPARVLAARVGVFNRLNRTTGGEWVASVARWAHTAGNVPEDLALGAAAAGPHAGVNALVVVASLVRGALVVAHALGPAGRVVSIKLIGWFNRLID